MCYSVIYNRRSPASHVLMANKPADWCLFFSFVLLAAVAASWVLCCSWYLFHGLDHEMRPKKGHRIPKEANLTEWERSPESHVFVDWHLALGVEC